MLKVGLTGGIGSGKSEVASRLAARGAVLIDADVIAREVVAPGTDGLAAIVATFGEQVLAEGALNRERLAEIVFADRDRLEELNSIVHPLVRARAAEVEAHAAKDAIVVHDVPLLAENQLAGGFDVVVVVDAPDQARLDRLVRLRGMSEEQARARMAAQANRSERLALADLVIDNSGSLASLDHQVCDVWAELSRRNPRDEPTARAPLSD